SPRSKNVTAIRKARISSLVTQRTSNSDFKACNNFIVLLANEKPVAVWAGSTGFSESGLFCDHNVGHVVRDSEVASKFAAYWFVLRNEPNAKTLRQWTEEVTPLTKRRLPHGTTCVFSPRSAPDLAHWYAEQISMGRAAICLALTSEGNALSKTVLEGDHPVLRYALCANTTDGLVTLQKRGPEHQLAISTKLEKGALKQWLRANSDAGKHRDVRLSYPNYLLIDPLGTDPMVVVGSTSFGERSTKWAEGNILVIRGDTRVADIYLGDFMTLFNDCYSRYYMEHLGNKHKPLFLRSDDSWSRAYFVPGSLKHNERVYFSGSPDRDHLGATGGRRAHELSHFRRQVNIWLEGESPFHVEEQR